MNNDFINLFVGAMLGEVSPEELLINGCGLSPEDAKEIVDSVEEAEKETLKARQTCESGHVVMRCKQAECLHFKVCMEWYSLGNDNCINDNCGGCEHYSTADFQTLSQMRLSELRTLLDNYDDKDMVQLRIYGSSDCPSADLVINDNTIMSDEY